MGVEIDGDRDSVWQRHLSEKELFAPGKKHRHQCPRLPGHIFVTSRWNLSFEGPSRTKAGILRPELTYTAGSEKGKLAANSNIVRVRCAELMPDNRIVEEVRFEIDDPAIDGIMTITTLLAPDTGGTKMTVTAENVPARLSEEDHRSALESSIRNLALLLE